jgi:hypothetical protein
MGGYQELREDFEWEQTVSGISGTRAFVEKTGGADSLPEIGDGHDFDQSFSNVTCKSLKAKISYWDSGAGGADKLKIIASYATPDPDDPDEQSDDELEEQRRYTSGAEIISIPSGKDRWKWATDGAVADIPISIVVGLNTFSISRVFDSDGAKNAWLSKSEKAQGTINAVTFEGHRKGSVMYMGTDGGTEYDNDGEKRWVFTLQFAYRNINDPDKELTQDDWLYVWRPDDEGEDGGKWDKPITKETVGKGLYKHTVFNTLL